MDKLTNIRNWTGKAFLLILGMVILAALFYPHIMAGFLLTDREVHDFGSGGDFLQLSIGTAFVAGGVFLNNILDGLSQGFKAFASQLGKLTITSKKDDN